MPESTNMDMNLNKAQYNVTKQNQNSIQECTWSDPQTKLKPLILEVIIGLATNCKIAPYETVKSSPNMSKINK